MISNYTDMLPGSKPRSGKNKNKYENKPGFYAGVWIQSKKEGGRYLELLEMERVGLISQLSRQPKFILIEAFDHKYGHQKRETYSADFRYIRDGKVIIEDVKGVKIDLFKIKLKILLKKYPSINFILT